MTHTVTLYLPDEVLHRYQRGSRSAAVPRRVPY
jgi:hypothetical protein